MTSIGILLNMYIREVTSARKHGSDVVYLQLVEGYRDRETGKVNIQILHSFGRKDKLDLEQVHRLVNQLSGYLNPEDQPDLLSAIEVTHSWDYGGPYLLDALWHELKSGGLRLDRSKIRREARLDGKTVLMTNDLKLPAEELVQGYHDLWLVERAFRSMKSILEIEPVYHRTPERITSHVHLCVLAYLLTRLVENRTGESWELARERLNQISLTGLKTERATVLKTKELNADERSFLNRCGADAPPKVLAIA